MTAPSPGIVATTHDERALRLPRSLRERARREMRKEYRAIHEAGLILQVDAPDLAMERVMMFQDETDDGIRQDRRDALAAINKACEGIPRDRWRLHICWGNWEGPHVYDIALAKVLPVFYQANVGALSIEFANPRHQHEYAALQAASVPEGHDPDPRRDRVDHQFRRASGSGGAAASRRRSAAVGDRERVIASTDCGFGTFAGREWVAAVVVWLKLKTMREGADIASQRLWGKKVA